MSDDLTTQQPPATGHPAAWPLGLAGAVLVIVGSFLSWSYDGSILGDLSINFYPGSLQILAIAVAVLALILLLTEKGPLHNRLGPWLDATLGLRALGLWLTIYMVLVVIAITVESDGLINVNPGGYIGSCVTSARRSCRAGRRSSPSR
jgi:branched-chain amino acid transport system permease protein